VAEITLYHKPKKGADLSVGWEHSSRNSLKLNGGSECESNPPENVNSTTCKATDGTNVYEKQ
jgi:hypothetical protein